MDDLYLIVFPNVRLRPIFTSDYGPVKFNGDTLSRHVETLKQVVEIKGFGKLLRLSIDKNSHIKMIQEFCERVNFRKILSVCDGLAYFDLFALADRSCYDSSSARLELRDLEIYRCKSVAVRYGVTDHGPKTRA